MSDDLDPLGRAIADEEKLIGTATSRSSDAQRLLHGPDGPPTAERLAASYQLAESDAYAVELTSLERADAAGHVHAPPHGAGQGTTRATRAVEALRAAGDAVVTVDRLGVITSWNPAAEALLGHTAEQALGQTLALVVPPEHRAGHVAAFHIAMDAAQLAHGGRAARVLAMTANCEELALGMSLGLLTDGAGSAVGAVAILRDLSVDLVPFVRPTPP